MEVQRALARCLRGRCQARASGGASGQSPRNFGSTGWNGKEFHKTYSVLSGEPRPLRRASRVGGWHGTHFTSLVMNCVVENHGVPVEGWKTRSKTLREKERVAFWPFAVACSASRTAMRTAMLSNASTLWSYMNEVLRSGWLRY